MFTVNGIDGQLFRGTLEDLLEMHRVARLTRIRGVRKDGDSEVPEGSRGPSDERRYEAAATAYAANLKLTTERGPIHHAYQIMTRKVLTFPEETSTKQAWRALSERGVGQAPVINRQHQLVGLVSRENLLHVLNEEQGSVRDVLSRAVGDVMETPVVTADPVSEVRRVVRVMLDYGLPAVPIADSSSGELVGIVSRGDILRVVVTDPPLTLWG
jgi:CBS domain-containing protein